MVVVERSGGGIERRLDGIGGILHERHNLSNLAFLELWKELYERC